MNESELNAILADMQADERYYWSMLGIHAKDLMAERGKDKPNPAEVERLAGYVTMYTNRWYICHEYKRKLALAMAGTSEVLHAT